MEERNKKIITILGILAIIFTIIGGTLAIWMWQTSTTQRTQVTFTVGQGFSCSADGGGDITQNDLRLVPTEVNNTTTGNYIKRTITTDIEITETGKVVYMDLWLDIKALGTELSNTEYFMYALTDMESTDPENDNIVLGNFKGLVANQNKIMLLESSTETAGEYLLWIWLDDLEENNATMNQTFRLELGGSCTDQAPPPPDPTEIPVLDDGLIPVILSDDVANGYKVTATTVDDPNWYSYGNKQWANAVLVKDEGTKTRAQNSVPTTEIDTDDILAYFVWIPRYAYQIWTLAESSTGNEQQIAIEWENANASYRAGTQVGEYRTHPAFWRDNNSNNAVDSGETIAGIWVGKFETTGDATTPTVLPNTAPLANQNVSTQFQTGLKFAGGTLSNGAVSFSTTNSYGIELTLTSHMMKNSEWGAVAYLSHSAYGRCTNGGCEEIRINNYNNPYSGRKTGCGALEADASSSKTCSNAYASGISAYPQSTTGNISGIFDMSGGLNDFVMGVFANSNGDLWSGPSTSYNSGFNGLVGALTSGTEYTEGIPFPTETKYYDVYKASSGTTISSLTACNGGICYGHALSEVKSWYSDYGIFVNNGSSWFERGGYYNDDARAGAFRFYNFNGSSSPSGGFRSVLVP